MREIYEIGTQVDLGNGLRGTVLEVCIKAAGEQYRVAWWEGRTRKCEWLEECELSPIDATTQTEFPIAFITKYVNHWKEQQRS